MSHKGFTLIELMIVVAIIGILSMFAMPAYQDYTKRTYVSEGLALASAAKIAAIEYFTTEGKWAGNNQEVGLPIAGSINAQAVRAIGIYRGLYAKASSSAIVSGSATNIVIYYNNKVLAANVAPVSLPNSASAGAAAAGNGVLILAPVYTDTSTGSMQWACRFADRNIQAKWLPTNCREQEANNENNAGR